jgi:hypothetical protein
VESVRSRLERLPICRRTEKGRQGVVMTDDERHKLVSTELPLGMAPEPRMPSSLSGLEVFGDEEKDDSPASDFSDADSFFNLPSGGEDEDEEDDSRR